MTQFYIMGKIDAKISILILDILLMENFPSELITIEISSHLDYPSKACLYSTCNSLLKFKSSININGDEFVSK